MYLKIVEKSIKTKKDLTVKKKKKNLTAKKAKYFILILNSCFLKKNALNTKKKKNRERKF